MPRQVLAEDQVKQFLNSQNSSNGWVSPEWLQYPEVSALERFMQQRMSSFLLSNELFFLLSCINCIVYFSVVFVKHLQLFTKDP